MRRHRTRANGFGAWGSVIGTVLMLGGCSGAESAEPGESNADGVCEASDSDLTVGTLSLADYCARFEAACPTYEEAAAQRWGACSEPGSRSWTTTRQEGCGQILIGADGGLGGTVYVFDADSRELVGVRAYSDTPLDSCHFTLVAGAPITCAEGELCSRCGDQVGECVAACSIDALTRRPSGGNYRLEDARLQSCVGRAENERPRLSTGCGRVTHEFGGLVAVFDEVTRSLVAVRDTDPSRDTSACGGAWGEPRAACDDVVTCSLCSDDADRCIP